MTDPVHTDPASASSSTDLTFRATHDSLTRIANRAHIIDHIDAAIERYHEVREPYAVLFCDLDRFKIINDTMGHEVGDQVLITVADRLKGVCGSTGRVGRLGGDEFAVVITAAAANEVARIADRIVEELHHPVTVNGRVVFVSTSVGYTVAHLGHTNASAVLHEADIALYDAKNGGRDRAQRFSPEHAEQLRARAEIEHDLRVAVQRNQLEMRYRPIVDGRTGTPVGVDALLRWHRPGHGITYPATFVPVAEETGLIGLMDRFAVFESCRALAEWRRGAPDAPSMLAVHVSGRDLTDPGTVHMIRAAIEHAELDPRALCIEISENSLFAAGPATHDSMRELREFGCYIALGNFGTGPSSFHSLRTLPIEVVKIDRSFVNGVAAHTEDRAVISAVLSLAHALGMHVIADGVEHPDQVQALLELGCNAMQGRLFGPPRTARAARHNWQELVDTRSETSRVPRTAHEAGERLFIHEFMQQMGIPLAEDR